MTYDLSPSQILPTMTYLSDYLSVFHAGKQQLWKEGGEYCKEE